MTDPQISVIVPTYRRPEILRKTLQGLCRQSFPMETVEILVICDGSDEATRLITEEFSAELSPRYKEQLKRGVAAARNLGAKLATAPVILFLDDDVIPGPDLLRKHAEFHAESIDDRAALLGYVTWHPDQQVTHYMRWYGEYGALFGFALLKKDIDVDARFFYSCNISLKRQFLTSHGGFNESLTVMEDNELGFRLAADGMQLRYDKTAVGYHYQQFTFEQSCERLARYSSGLKAFLATEAGKSLMKRRRTFVFRFTDLSIRTLVPLMVFFRPLLDSTMPLPRALYRMFYWYYGSHRSFWSKSEG